MSSYAILFFFFLFLFEACLVLPNAHAYYLKSCKKSFIIVFLLIIILLTIVNGLIEPVNIFTF